MIKEPNVDELSVRAGVRTVRSTLNMVTMLWEFPPQPRILAPELLDPIFRQLVIIPPAHAPVMPEFPSEYK